MYLQKLEINGFKSFARRTVLEFDKGITSVVGPNGSGKSNVAESLKWVMGEQSLKSLRGKKSTDVIFSGSDKAARLGMAEVSLYFDNSDGRAPIDYSEVVITRKIFRDGHSEYYINQKQTRLQDILLLLAEINLSSKTYSVIGQGMVDMILSITPAERKEFFEEASGVRPLQIKKHESLRKLNATQDNLQTIDIQLQEIQPRLRSLTRQVKRLDERAELEAKLQDLQYHYYGETLYTLTKELTDLKNSEAAVNTKIVALEHEIEKLQKEMYSLTRESSQSEQFDALQNEYQKLFQEKTSLKEKELSIHATLMQSARQNVKTHVPVQIVKQVTISWEQLHNELQALQKRFTQELNQQELADLENDFGVIVQKINHVFEPFKPYVHVDTSSTKESEEQLAQVRKEIAQLDEQLQQVQKNIKELSSKEKEEKDIIWETQRTLQEKQRAINTVMNERNDIKVKQARVETRVSDLESEILEENSEFLTRVRGWKPAQDHPSNDSDKVRQDIHGLKHQLDIIGGIDPNVRSEYEEINERFTFLTTQSGDLTKTIAHLHGVIVNLDETIKKQFNSSFKRINTEFQKFFSTLFNGGKSELTLVRGVTEPSEDADDPSVDSGQVKPNEEDEVVGVDISATPPGKKLKSIHMLSGGEKALTSIALICAIISNNPAPFVVLDEVDAALDEANSVRFSEIVEELGSKTQFIVITHNRASMEKAQLLYGVTMGDDGISRLLSLKLEDAQTYTNR